MKWINKLFLSMESMFVMVALFGLAIAAATFIENDYGPAASRAVVYDTRWFQVLLILLMANLIANIIRYRLYRKEKWLTLLFHVSFAVILAGSAVTRDFGYEGSMHIREGEESRVIASSKTYLKIKAVSGSEEITLERPLALSSLSRNRFTETFTVAGRQIVIRYADFIPHAEKVLVDDPQGETLVSLSATRGSSRERLFLHQGESVDMDGIALIFGADSSGNSPFIRILREKDGLALISNLSLTVTSMKERVKRYIEPGEPVELTPMILYSTKGIQIVFLGFTDSGRIEAAKPEQRAGVRIDEEAPDALLLEIQAGAAGRNVTLFEGAGLEGEVEKIKISDVDLDLAYGSGEIELPFSLQCVDFEIGRYPGSMKPSSFASEVVIRDSLMGVERPYRIYMNHILKYRGYRFFQSSYDDDEMGTILQVTCDPGTPITYIGFLLLGICLFAHLFMPQSRFRRLGKKIAGKGIVLVLCGLGFAGVLGAAGVSENAGISGTATAELAELPRITVADLKKIPLKHAALFGSLLVQDTQGRIKPVNSMGRETLRAVRPGHPPGLSPDRIMLGMLVMPEAWESVPMIEVKDGVLRRALGMRPEESVASHAQFFDQTSGQLKLEGVISASRQKDALSRSRTEKEALKINSMLDELEGVLSGKPFRFFPKPGDPNNRWYSYQEISGPEPSPMARTMVPPFPEEEGKKVAALFEAYRLAAVTGMAGGSWDEADKSLSEIAAYQTANGSAILPSSRSVRAEILHNWLNLFQNLAWLFSLAGIAALVWGIIRMKKPVKGKDNAAHVIFLLVFAGFILHTTGLALRWIASAHAPWSNKYESLIFIAWAVVLAGIVLSRRTLLALASSSLLAGLILFVSHMGWTDPKITTLPPVLKSYWLVVHVSVITSSYGFFGMAAVSGFLNLVLLLFHRGEKDTVFGASLRKLSWINEQALLAGLVLVNVGNIFGAVWANESWGRYWGWDPKETWTLVIILAYTAVLHLRLIPAFRRIYFYALNSGAVIAFGSVMMTYFGVNFYLSGLHSYAGGDPVPIPLWVYITAAVIALVIAAVYPKRKSLAGEE